MNHSVFSGCGYISFDVFDTLLTRRYLKPEHLFLDLEKLLRREGITLTNFANIRKESEFEVRRRGNFQVETNLDEIYREIRDRMQLSTDMLSRCIEKELELEEQSIVVNNRARNLVLGLRDQGKKLIFVSDTYFPRSFMEGLLSGQGLMAEGDTVYISSDTGKMKANGEMFRHILSDLAITPGQLCHIGDNRQSDVEMPRRLGIRALHYNEVFDSRFEGYPGDCVIISRVVSISKITRLQRMFPDEHRQTIWNVTADVAAPLIFFFVYWCIIKAVQKNIPRLYFLARDGQIMHRMAGRIIARHFPGMVEARYLYVSRQSLLFPGIRELDDEAFEWIMAPTALLTPRIILRRINLAAEEIHPLLKKFSFGDRLDRHLSHPERARFRKMLEEAGPLIMAKVKEYRRDTLDYLRQEGLMEDDLFAVVDIGWSGTLQRSISRMLDIAGRDTPVHGFYFGLKNRKKHKEEDKLFSWFTDYRCPRELDRKTYIVPMTELFTAADHGGVRQYTRREGRVLPVLHSEINTNGMKWGVGLQQEAMLEYTDHALTIEPALLSRITKRYRGWFERIYDKFLTEPTYLEAKVYGSYLDAEDQNESYYRPLARKYSPLELYRMRRENYKHHHNEWQEGAMMLTRHGLRKLFGLAAKDQREPGKILLRRDQYFFIVSYPRSGNTWVVNSLKDYLGAQRAEILQSAAYGGEILEIENGIEVKTAGFYDPSVPVGIKTHMVKGEFEERNMPRNNIIYLLRDVRDVMTSYYFYLNGFLGRDVDKARNFSPAHFTEHLVRELPDYRNHLVGWLKLYKGTLCVVRYEDLKADYIATLHKIRDFLAMPERLPAGEVKRRYVDNFKKIDNFDNVLQGRNTDFYRKGVVGDWVNYFTDEHAAIVKREVGGLMVELGYEKDLDW